MAISRHAASSYVESSATSITIPYPANSVGDIIILAVKNDSYAYYATTPSGWTMIDNTYNQVGGSLSLYVFWQYVSVVQSGSVTVNFSSNGSLTGAMVSYSGVDSSPPSVHGVNNNPGSNSVVSASLAFSNYAVWVFGSNWNYAASTVSSVASTAGGWVPSAAVADGDAQYAMHIYDGAIGTTTTTLNATYSTNGGTSNVALALVPGGSSPSGTGISLAWIHI